MTPWTISTVADLERAFATIPDGGTIELTPGNYARAELTDRDFVTGVTITSAVADDRAVFTDRLILEDVSGVTVEALDLRAAQIATHGNYPRLKVKDSADVTITDVTIAGHIASADEGQDPFADSTRRLDPIAGYGQDTGLNVNGSTGVTITGVELTDLRLGISLSGVHDTTVRDTEIHAVREGININDARNLLIEDNVFRNFTPWLTGKKSNIDHADMIQFWATQSDFGVHDLTIRNNLFRQDAGDRETQTIFGHGRNAGPDATLTNFTIEGNTIINGQAHGISITDVTGVRIRENVLLPQADLPDMPDQVDRPAIWSVRNTDVEIAGNTLLPLSNLRDMKIDDSTDVTLTDNIILSYTPSSPLFWRKVFERIEAGTWEHGGADPDRVAVDVDVVPDPQPDGPVDDGPVDDGPADDGPRQDGSLDDAPDAPLDDGQAGPAAIIKAARDAGWLERTADPAGSVLDPGGVPTLLVGNDGHDWLRGRGTDTIMFGGDSGDKFAFDFRNPDSAARHVVLDLDWAGSDYLKLLTPGGNHFAQSWDDLDVLIADGHLRVVPRDTGAGLLLHVADRPDQQIELATMAALDALDWIA
ncbi:NosD domain-containing protein [Meridianimarinicoccus sp. RP-17]|uniref:NosD domain-containing protein n=1 Tax=Meridianimarinicoccus zhengii TaxID=2056810 RepID=UPI0013A6C401|nr:right-handed parallel beta-helix repeat-containing protein [Phycocomes zhengii]